MATLDLPDIICPQLQAKGVDKYIYIRQIQSGHGINIK